jgi:hypothetical protein
MQLKLILLLSILFLFHSEHVCSQDELILDIIKDLADNGKLDCLRSRIPEPNETKEQKDLRDAALWSSDCAFEATSCFLTRV